MDEETEKTVVFCSVCGNNLRYREITIIGMAISTGIGDDAPEEMKVAVAQALEPYQFNKKYYICYPCWFRSFGIKP